VSLLPTGQGDDGAALHAGAGLIAFACRRHECERTSGGYEYSVF